MVMLRRSLDGVLGQLANEGLLTEAQLEPAGAAAANRPEATPWFVRVLVGAGAWIASGLVLVFLWRGQAARRRGQPARLGRALSTAAPWRCGG
jgi:hypothetical protein